MNDELVANFDGGAGPADCSVFYAVKTSDTDFIMSAGQTVSYYMLAARLDNTSTTLFGLAGTPTIYIDGALFSGTTRGDLSTALSDNQWHVLEVRTADLSGWSKIGLANHEDFSTWSLGGDISAAMIVETADLTDANRRTIETYLRSTFS